MSAEFEGMDYEIVNHAQKIAMRMSWDLKTFPYLWVWGVYHGPEEYPRYGRSYVLAVEPWSSAPGNDGQAKENGSLPHLKPEMGSFLSAKIVFEYLTEGVLPERINYTPVYVLTSECIEADDKRE